MSRIFIDTNILVSAIVFDKKELELIIRSIDQGDSIFVSEHIVEESIRVFEKKFHEYIEIFNKFIKTSELEVIKRKVYNKKIKNYKNIRDKYDAHVIACAEAVNCEYIISGDKDLLSYKHKKIRILRSSEFLKHLEKR